MMQSTRCVKVLLQCSEAMQKVEQNELKLTSFIQHEQLPSAYSRSALNASLPLEAE